MSKAESARPPTSYERFVEATKAILAAPKKDVEKAMRALRSKRKRQRQKRKT